MFQKILVPTDGSELSEKAVRGAIEIALMTKGSIVGLCVSQPYPYSPLSEGAIAGDAVEFENRSTKIANEHLEHIKAAAGDANVPCETIVTKSFEPYKDIVETAKKMNCDSIFMASHGRRGLNKLLLGSETQKVLAHAEVPVVVYR
ncbi:MAG: universal stress protein [Burkholderiaceae bacterium]